MGQTSAPLVVKASHECLLVLPPLSVRGLQCVPTRLDKKLGFLILGPALEPPRAGAARDAVFIWQGQGFWFHFLALLQKKKKMFCNKKLRCFAFINFDFR